MTIPANTAARVYVPASSGDQEFRVGGNAHVEYVGYEDGAHVYDVRDGNVTFNKRPR